MMNRDASLLRHFQLDPQVQYWGERHEEYAQRLLDAVENRRLLAVIGRFGSGKSVLVRETLSDAKAHQVYVNNPDKERLRISHVVTALVDKLGQERPRQDMIARTSQIARIMGERVVLRGQEVVVVIENAHRMHANTLLALKDLRESAIFKGVTPLFTVILVGQEPLLGKVQKFGEVRYRTKPIQLTPEAGWMDQRERTRYLKTIYGDTIAPATRERIAAMHDSPLEMDYFLEEKLELMRDAGIEVMDEDQVPISLREKRQAAGLSQGALERATQERGRRVPKSSISEIERGERDDPEVEALLHSAVDAAIAEKSSTSSSSASPPETPSRPAPSESPSAPKMRKVS